MTYLLFKDGLSLKIKKNTYSSVLHSTQYLRNYALVEDIDN